MYNIKVYYEGNLSNVLTKLREEIKEDFLKWLDDGERKETWKLHIVKENKIIYI